MLILKHLNMLYKTMPMHIKRVVIVFQINYTHFSVLQKKQHTKLRYL